MRTRSNYQILFINIIIFIYSIFIERINLNMDYIFSNHIVAYLLLKILFFILLLYILWKAKKVIYMYKSDPNIKIFILVSIVYFLINLLFLFLVYPGAWMNDSFDVWNRAMNLEIYPGQGYFITIFYLFSIMLVPNAVGVIIFEILIFSIIMGRFIMICYKNIGKYSIILSLIFLMPPVLLYNVFPLRAGFTGYLIILCGTILFEIIKNNNYSKNYLIELTFYICLLSQIRSELCFILPLYFIFLICIYRNKTSWRKSIIFCALTLIGILILKIPTQYYSDEEYGVYKLTPIINPLSSMIIDPELNILDEELESFNKIIPIDLLKKYSSSIDTPLLYMAPKDSWNRNPNREEYIRFLNSYIKLVLRNPEIFIKVRLETFLSTNGIGSLPIYLPDNLENNNENIYPIAISNTTAPKRNEIFKKLYNLKDEKEYILTSEILHFLFWNSIVPLLFSIITLIIGIYKKKLYSIILLMPIGEAIMIFLAVTNYNPMFHFPFYISGYALSFLVIWSYINEKK